MSQASDHVKWCISKSKKEIEECKKYGKRIKHRGLLEIKPDVNKAKEHIEKAEHNLDAIGKFKEIGFSDWSISAGFYCIYHCFLAICVKSGYELRNQTCTIALMEQLKEEGKISIDSRFIDMLKEADIEEIPESKVIEMREEYTYSIKISFEDETKIKKLKADCREIIDAVKGVIYK